MKIETNKKMDEKEESPMKSETLRLFDTFIVPVTNEEDTLKENVLTKNMKKKTQLLEKTVIIPVKKEENIMKESEASYKEKVNGKEVIVNKKEKTNHFQYFWVLNLSPEPDKPRSTIVKHTIE